MPPERPEDAARRMAAMSASSMVGARSAIEKMIKSLGDAATATDLVRKLTKELSEAQAKGGEQANARIKELVYNLSLVKEVIPDAFDYDTINAFAMATTRAFGATVVGVGRATSEFNTLAKAYQTMGKMSAADAQVAAAGTMKAQRQYSEIGYLENIARLREEKIAISKSGGETIAISQKIARARMENRQRGVLDSKAMTVADAMQRDAVRKNAQVSASSILSNDRGLLGSALNYAVNKSKALRDVVKAEQNEANTGIKMAKGNELMSVGIGELYSALTPMIKNVNLMSVGVSAAGMAFKMLIDIMDGSRKIGGRSMQALGMSSDEAFSSISTSALSSADDIRVASGLSAKALLSMGDAFYSQIIPAAQDAMLTFNTFDRDSMDKVNSWAGTLARVGVSGQRMGIDIGKSMGMAVTNIRAFGGTQDDASKTFEAVLDGAKESRLGLDDFTAGMASAVEVGRRFGNQGGMYASMGAIMSGLKGVSAVQRSAFGQSISGLAMNTDRVVGLRMFGGQNQGAAISSVVKAINSGGVGQTSGMFTLAMETYKKAISTQGAAGTLANPRSSDEQIYMAAKAAAGVMGPGGEWLQTALLDKTFRKAFLSADMSPKAISEREKTINDAAAKYGDPAERGAAAMRGQLGTLELIAGSLKTMVQMIGYMAASSIFKGSTMAERHAFHVARVAGGPANLMDTAALPGAK